MVNGDGTAEAPSISEPSVPAHPLGLSQGHMNGAGPVFELADGLLDLITPDTSPVKVTIVISCTVMIVTDCLPGSPLTPRKSRYP